MSDVTPGALKATDTGSRSNELQFLINIMMGKAAHVFAAQVISCTNAGQIKAAGTVNVTPLVNQIDAEGNVVPTQPIYGLPYFRLQSGLTSVIMDPVAKDIGIVVVCDRDVSSVKTNQAASNPGSARTFNEADGMYFGGFMNGLLNGTPNQFIQAIASSGGFNIVTPGPITWTASNTTLDASGNVKFNGEVTRGNGTSDQVDLGQHTHQVHSISTGSSTVTTQPPTAGT